MPVTQNHLERRGGLLQLVESAKVFDVLRTHSRIVGAGARRQRLSAADRSAWEYACRAGTRDLVLRQRQKIVSSIARLVCTQTQTATLMRWPRRRPTPSVLFDMHGNGVEYCQDYYDASYCEA